MRFQDKLDEIVKKNNSLLCIGLDPVLEKLPEEFKNNPHPFFEFNKTIIDATVDLVCAYKPNSAFYEALGHEGVEELRMTVDYLKISHPDIPVILDAKRGDIDSTNDGYVKFAFDYLEADAITIHPYLGKQASMPFLERRDKGIFVLCHTSNKGAEEFQNLEVGGKELYKKVAENVAQQWNEFGNCYMVIGATYPEELAQVRKIAGDMTFLIPGIGAQGGDVEKTVKAGLNSKDEGLIISASRSIIYSDDPRKEAEALRNEINKYRMSSRT